MAAPIPYTCPDIDNVIADIATQCKELDFACSEIDNENYSSAKSIIENVSSQLTQYHYSPRWGRETNPLEQLRASNDSLRNWGTEKEEELQLADDKISTLEAEIESFEYQLKEVNDLNERLQKEIADADELLNCKDSEINDLKAQLLMYVK